MKPDFKSSNLPVTKWLLVAALLVALAALTAACSGTPQPSPTAQIVTVVMTVPVEVTRVVEMVSTVEVTRPVLVTVVVEVPVTPEATATNPPPPRQPTATINYLPTPTPLVQEFDDVKKEGVSRLKIDNTTDETLTAKIIGDKSFEIEIPQGKSAFLSVPYGDYTVRVYNGNKRMYTARLSCVNPDKYTIILGGDKASVITP